MSADAAAKATFSAHVLNVAFRNLAATTEGAR